MTEEQFINKYLEMMEIDEATKLTFAGVKDLLSAVYESDINFIYDGFGTTWSKRCPECGKDSMVVVRPGKAQCDSCE